jgi:tetratricopeptide (TPR) repeat protein
MLIKDPTAWMEDLEFYMDDEDIADTAAAMEPTLLYGGSKLAAGAWVGLVGILGGALGAVTLSPAIRTRSVFVGYLLVAALILRGLHPLTRRLMNRAVAWHAMFAFFWAVLLGCCVILGGRVESRLFAYGLSVGGGAFIGLLFGSLTPSVTSREDAWMIASLPLAPLSAGFATYVLRHATGASATLSGPALAGALAGAMFLVPMGILLARLWDEAQGLARMGLLYLHNDNFAPKAVAYFDRAIAIDPDNARHYLLRGVGHSRMSDSERALADWNQALTIAPEDPEPHFCRGVDFLRRGLFDDAVRSCKAAIEKNPGLSRAHRLIGMVYERQGDVERAIEQYDRAIDVDADDARAYSSRAAAYFTRAEYERAIRDAERAIDIDSGLSSAYVVRGHGLAALGRAADAANSYRDALDLKPAPSLRLEAVRALESLVQSTRERGASA